jgi:hypothetical protein
MIGELSMNCGNSIATTYHPSSKVCNDSIPSSSSIDDNRARTAVCTSSLIVSFFSCSRDLTRGFKTAESRLLRASPATVTSAARARALNAEIGCAVSVGSNVGNTVVARTYKQQEESLQYPVKTKMRRSKLTLMTSLSAIKAASDF